MKITLLGVGRMGHELGVHLLRAGHELTAWNRTPAAAQRLVDAGAHRADSREDAVREADVVMTVLFGPDTVREVVLSGLEIPAEAVWFDVTTVSPEDAREFADYATAAGVRYVHGPVIGSLAPARAGTLGVLLGGSDADVDVVEPLAALWADEERLRRVATPSDAATGKLLANLALGVTLQGLIEALRLGTANGLDAEVVLDLLSGTGLGVIAGMKGAVITAGTFDDTQFSADLLAKDARLMLRSTPDPLPAVTALLQSLTEAQRAGLGDYDIAVIAKPELG
ncbi:NAD(P)-dependent oxidoreductase [Arthrobacter agilis]|uniref:NAD(P)-dependent oxidoreductase n=1 Tax=Arthrobacter agilis TaxID=37921 RepID=UPI000B36116D|nr:NAD(P)-dependent oxidoreductase [Arthrobacter agilis]OUM40649.1 oxidoreductase [Arthrobacter agilis]PPB45259.1 NAD(P)-dependent oxidoreductase [Arthrobacter agilis]TPV27965.1 NAD(P)-dependent oxidoreductase [Arthrobacter agilis]VDR31347.1 2-(hydroxymethyl)glutarate dehydrogenase [Arthrobacter agilis]